MGAPRPATSCLLTPFPSSQPDSQPPPRPGRPGHRSGNERKPGPHVPSVSLWHPHPTPRPLCRAAGPSHWLGQENKSGFGDLPQHGLRGLQEAVPCTLLCFLGLINREANGGRWAPMSCLQVSQASRRGHLESLFVPVSTLNQRVLVDPF